MERAVSGRLNDRVAVVTGGASGMGRATALRFLEEGARVVIGDLNEEKAAETLALAGQRDWSDRIAFQATDVAEEADIEALLALAVDRFGRLDCVFNNAGIGGVFGPIDQLEVADWDQTVAVLLRSVFLGMKHGARIMKRQGEGGSIISTASIAGINGGGGPTCYSAAKAAVINLTKTVSMELAEAHIRVNAIAPGIIWTPLLRPDDPDTVLPEMIAKQPWPEPGRPEHIAAAALYLASDDSAFVTGECLTVDGGLMAQGSNLWGRGASGRFQNFAGYNAGSTGQPSSYARVDRDDDG